MRHRTSFRLMQQSCVLFRPVITWIKKRADLFPSELGFKVNDFLIKVLPSLFEIDFYFPNGKPSLTKLNPANWPGLICWRNFMSTLSLGFKAAKCYGAPEHEKAQAVIDQLGYN